MAGGFNLGERDITILVKNGSRKDPENTVFKLNETYHKGIYLVRDFLEVGNNGLSLDFSNLHCNYNAKIKIDPNVYSKYITVNYGYNANGECIYKVVPEEYAKLTTVTVTPRTEMLETIKLNDLGFMNQVAYFIFGLFLIVFLGIQYIEKKKILIYNKKQ